MRSAVLAFAGLAAAAVPAAPETYGHNGTAPVTEGGDKYVTEVVTAYTTYCPEPTSIEHDGQTYTVTEATTLVIPCETGCTVTYPATSSSVVTECSTCTPAAPVETPAETPAAPVETPEETPVAPVPTTPAGTGVVPGAPQPFGTGSPTGPAEGTGSPIAPSQTGAAGKLTVGSAGLLGLFGLFFGL